MKVENSVGAIKYSDKEKVKLMSFFLKHIWGQEKYKTTGTNTWNST